MIPEIKLMSLRVQLHVYTPQHVFTHTHGNMYTDIYICIPSTHMHTLEGKNKVKVQIRILWCVLCC